MSRLRASLRIARLVLILLAFAPPHLLARATGRPSRWPRRFLDAAARAAGLEVMVEGTLPAGPLLIVANHISWMDILALGAATGTGFVSKADIASWPVAGWLARQGGTVFVDRADRARAREQARALAAALAEGRRIALFPEGGTGPADRLRPFRPALFAAVAPPAPPVPVLPVALDYGADAGVVAWPDAEGAVANTLRLLGLPGRRRVTVRLLPPIDPATTGDRKAVAAEAQARIAAALPFSSPPDGRSARG